MEFMGATFLYRGGSVPRVFINDQMISISRGAFTWDKQSYSATLNEEDAIDPDGKPVRRVAGMQIQRVEIKQPVAAKLKPAKKKQLQRPARKIPREYAPR